jgi:polysaccharide export outer membrane protein
LLVAAVLFLLVMPLRPQEPSPVPEDKPSRIALPASPAPDRQSGARDVVISPDDVLDLLVLDVPEFSGHYRVSPTGSITLPLLQGAIHAAGLTPNELSQVIGEKLRAGGFVNNPQVTISVRESRVHSVAVTGAVKRPQIYPLFSPTTLLDVLSQAEGLAEDASTTAVVTRGEVALGALKEEGQCEQLDHQEACSATLTVDLKKLLDTGDPHLNIVLYPGDRVTVPRAGIIYVVGAVNRPGGFPLKYDREEMTVLKALALAQDLKPSAVKGKAMIIRRNSPRPEGKEEIPLDLKKILARQAPDVSLEANDILFVPDSTSKKALIRGAEAAVQTVSGVIIWRRP